MTLVKATILILIFLLYEVSLFDVILQKNNIMVKNDNQRNFKECMEEERDVIQLTDYLFIVNKDFYL